MFHFSFHNESSICLVCSMFHSTMRVPSAVFHVLFHNGSSTRHFLCSVPELEFHVPSSMFRSAMGVPPAVFHVLFHNGSSIHCVPCSVLLWEFHPPYSMFRSIIGVSPTFFHVPFSQLLGCLENSVGGAYLLAYTNFFFFFFLTCLYFLLWCYLLKPQVGNPGSCDD